MRARFKETVGYFFALYVDPDHRGQGIASNLINQSLRYVQENGCTVATLTVGNMQYAALSLYKKLGFEIQGETMFKYYRPTKKHTEGIVCFIKQLNQI